jgi:hypothetical protein
MIIPHAPDTHAPGEFDLPLTGTEITSKSGRECPIDNGLDHVAWQPLAVSDRMLE